MKPTIIVFTIPDKCKNRNDKVFAIKTDYDLNISSFNTRNGRIIR